MRLNYSLSPELYLNFLRSNFNDLPCADAVPVSSTASPDTLAAFGLYDRKAPWAMTSVADRKYVISSRS